MTSQRRLWCISLRLSSGCRWCLALARGRVVAPPQSHSNSTVNSSPPSPQYDAGHFAEAATQLENLLHEVPESFEAHELLGLVYAAQSQDALAKQHLEAAVRLKPDSAAARTNLAANLIRLGDVEGAGSNSRRRSSSLPKALTPTIIWANSTFNLGKLPEATPFLKQAQKINPASYDNGYDLALAYLLTGGFRMPGNLFMLS